MTDDAYVERIADLEIERAALIRRLKELREDQEAYRREVNRLASLYVGEIERLRMVIVGHIRQLVTLSKLRQQYAPSKLADLASDLAELAGPMRTGGQP